MTEPDTARPFNQYGGLTLIPMPGFEALALEVKRRVEAGSYEFDTSIDVADFEFGYRASGEPYVRLGKEHVAGHDCVVLTSGPGTPAMLLQLMLILRYLSGRRASRITVVTGYFPLGRSDKDEGSLEFALPPLIIDLMMMSTYSGLDRPAFQAEGSPDGLIAAGGAAVSPARNAGKWKTHD